MKQFFLAILFSVNYSFAQSSVVKDTVAQSSITFDAGQIFSTFLFYNSNGNKDNNYKYNLSGAYNLGYQYDGQSGLLFRSNVGIKKMGSSLVHDGLNYNWILQYLSLNIGGGYILNKFRFKPYIVVSPFYSYLLTATQSMGNENYDIKENNSIKKFDCGFQFTHGVKLTLSEYISIYSELNYILGLQNIETSPSQNLYNRGFSINIGIAATIIKKNKPTEPTKSVLEKQLISNPDSLSILAEKKDIIKQQQQQQLKITNPSETSDTLRVMLALMKKRHQEDSIKLINKQMEAVENLKTFAGQVKANEGNGSNVDKDKNLAQMDSIKQANKQIVAVENYKTFGGPVKADEGNRSNSDKDKYWKQMDSLINVLTGKIKPGAKISANDLARIEESKITKSDLAKFVDKTVYTIQIGAYTSGLPKNILAEVLKLDLEVESYKDEKDGLTKYFIGNYNTYEAASNASTALEQRGLKGPFVIVINNGEIISVKELINKKGK